MSDQSDEDCEETSVWDLFDKIKNAAKPSAECRICNRVFACSTSANLKAHLYHKHSDLVKVRSLPSKKTESNSGVKTREIVWKYFTSVGSNGERLALCSLCKEVRSYKSTIANLRSHLLKAHKGVFEENQGDYSMVPHEATEEIIYYEDSDESCTSNSSSRNYFEKQVDGDARCLMCQKSVPNRSRYMKQHLKTAHSRQAQSSDDEGSDGREADETNGEEVYTELIYLDEEAPNTVKKESLQSKIQIIEKKRAKRKPSRKASTSSEDTPSKRPAKSPTNEIDDFGKYVTSLLKTVPPEVCTKLQMEIINLIMKSKLSHNEVILNATPQAPVIVTDGTKYVITLPSNSESNVNGILNGSTDNVSYTVASSEKNSSVTE